MQANRIVELIAVALGLLGLVLVIVYPGEWRALLPWLVSNPLMVCVTLRAGLYLSCLLWMIYFCVTLGGVVRWLI